MAVFIRRMIGSIMTSSTRREEYPAEAEIQEQAGQALPGAAFENNGQSKGRMFSSTQRIFSAFVGKLLTALFHLQVWAVPAPGIITCFRAGFDRLDLVPAFRNSSWNRGPAKFYRLFLIKSPATGRFMFL